jgi:hypothetical protein
MPEVRISAWLCSSWSPTPFWAAADFSAKEKDEASPSRVCALGSEMPSFSDLQGLKAFCFFTLAGLAVNLERVLACLTRKIST